MADVHEQLTRIRGAQAGFWRDGWLLKVRVDALIAAHRTAPAATDRQHELRMLNGFVVPRVAALALLALRTRLPPARLAVLNADQLTNDCSTLDLGGETITFEPDESILLRAQLLDAERKGHPANGPLFCSGLGRRMSSGNLQQTLRRAAVDTGLPLTQTWSPPIDRHHSHWMHRRGLSIQHSPRTPADNHWNFWTASACGSSGMCAGSRSAAWRVISASAPPRSRASKQARTMRLYPYGSSPISPVCLEWRLPNSSHATGVSRPSRRPTTRPSKRRWP